MTGRAVGDAGQRSSPSMTIESTLNKATNSSSIQAKPTTKRRRGL